MINIAVVPKRQARAIRRHLTTLSGRVRQQLGNDGGLTDFGVSLMRLPPGYWSSQRHWHSGADELAGWLFPKADIEAAAHGSLRLRSWDRGGDHGRPAAA
jgi:hypothetical protein